MTRKEIQRGVFRWDTSNIYLIFDTRYHPIVPCRWCGDITEHDVEMFWKMRDSVAYDGVAKKILLVHYFDVKPPPATVRKRGADLAQNDPYIQDGTFVSVMILKNPLLRGVMTAVLWMAGKENFPMEFASGSDEAFAIAKRILERAGVTSPNIPPNYEIPETDTIRWTP